MPLIGWILIFVVSLIVLVKGADWFLLNAEKVGLSFGLSPFVVGVTIVAMGTSLPELLSGFFALSKGAPEIVAGNAIGSNIANILLVVGMATVAGKKLRVAKNLINLDLPLLAMATGLFIMLAADGGISRPEAFLLIAGYVVHLLYTLRHRDDDEKLSVEDIDLNHKEHALEPLVKQKEKITPRVIFGLIGGALGLVIGAQFLIKSVIGISDILSIGKDVIAVSAVALGTSLPELIVSVKAALQGKSEVAIGNIFGSNIFNLLVVVGLPGLFTYLPIQSETLVVGLPMLALATLLFVISGISRKIYIWEGSFYLILYIVFIGQLFGFL